MSATDPIHQEITYENGEWKQSSYESMTPEEVEKALKGAAFPYQWGVYTTCLARKQLQLAIKKCGDKILYCDTDSVKTLGPAPIMELNETLQARAADMGAYADDMHGVRHYIGVFEPDAHYRFFISQGAKRYAFVKDNGKLGITVAGVSTEINEETETSFAVEELIAAAGFPADSDREFTDAELKNILKKFEPGMIWSKAGGTLSVFNDADDFEYTDPASGKTVHIGKNVSIIPTTYEMTYSDDYRLLLNGGIKLFAKYRKGVE